MRLRLAEGFPLLTNRGGEESRGRGLGVCVSQRRGQNKYEKQQRVEMADDVT